MVPFTIIPPSATGAKMNPPNRNRAKIAPPIIAKTNARYQVRFIQETLYMKGRTHKAATPNLKAATSYIVSELIAPILNKSTDVCQMIKKENLIYMTMNEIIEIDKGNKSIFKLLFMSYGYTNL